VFKKYLSWLSLYFTNLFYWLLALILNILYFACCECLKKAFITFEILITECIILYISLLVVIILICSSYKTSIGNSSIHTYKFSLLFILSLCTIIYFDHLKSVLVLVHYSFYKICVRLFIILSFFNKYEIIFRRTIIDHPLIIYL